jgi:hypothetical protein
MMIVSGARQHPIDKKWYWGTSFQGNFSDNWSDIHYENGPYDTREDCEDAGWDGYQMKRTKIPDEMQNPKSWVMKQVEMELFYGAKYY